MTPWLSVVIICWNSLANLQGLLASLPAALAGIGHEIILVDNGSSDGTDRYIAATYPDIVYRRLDRNRGVAYARNRGIELASGRYIWLLDDDTVVNADAVGALINYMEAHSCCGICACALRAPDGALQRSYKLFPGLMPKLRGLLGMEGTDPYAPEMSAGLPFEPEYVIGACQLVRREVFDAVGLLDEHIFYGPEDADFCLRARKVGWHVVYLPAVSIVHKWKRITSRRPLSAIGRAHIRALFYFYRKHRRLR